MESFCSTWLVQLISRKADQDQLDFGRKKKRAKGECKMLAYCRAFAVVALLSCLTSPTMAYGEVYKCVVKGQTHYQDHECIGESKSVKLRPEISKEEQQRAQESLRDVLERNKLRERQQFDLINEQRRIRAEEDKARAMEREADKPPVVIINRGFESFVY